MSPAHGHGQTRRLAQDLGPSPGRLGEGRAAVQSAGRPLRELLHQSQEGVRGSGVREGRPEE